MVFRIFAAFSYSCDHMSPLLRVMIIMVLVTAASLIEKCGNLLCHFLDFSRFLTKRKSQCRKPFCLSLLIMVDGRVNAKLKADGRLSIFNTTFHQYKIPFCFCTPLQRIMGGINVFASWQTSRRTPMVHSEGDKIEIMEEEENAERVSSMCPPD